MLHTAFAWSHIYIQHNKHISPVRLPTTTHVSSVTKTTNATAQHDNGETTVRYTHPASWRQCSRIGTCSSCCFRTYSLARRCCTRRSLGRTNIFNNINTSALYAFRLPLIFGSSNKTTRTTTERDSGEITVRYTHHTSWRQCFRLGTWGRCCFGTCFLARRCRTRWSLCRTPIFNTINTCPLYAFRQQIMFRSVTKTTRAIQNVTVESLQ